MQYVTGYKTSDDKFFEDAAEARLHEARFNLTTLVNNSIININSQDVLTVLQWYPEEAKAYITAFLEIKYKEEEVEPIRIEVDAYAAEPNETETEAKK